MVIPGVGAATARDSKLRAIISAAMLSMPIIAIIAILYHDVVRDLTMDWWSVPSVSQGFLIPPLSVWIARNFRAELMAVPKRIEAPGLLLVTTACAAFLFG